MKMTHSTNLTSRFCLAALTSLSLPQLCFASGDQEASNGEPFGVVWVVAVIAAVAAWGWYRSDQRTTNERIAMRRENEDLANQVQSTRHELEQLKRKESEVSQCFHRWHRGESTDEELFDGLEKLLIDPLPAVVTDDGDIRMTGVTFARKRNQSAG